MRKYRFRVLSLLLCIVMLFCACAEDPPIHTHTEVTDPAVAPTCYADGLTEGKHCSSCGEVLLAQTVLPKTNAHQFGGEWQSDGTYHWQRCQNANCPIAGRKGTHRLDTDPQQGYYCTVCAIGESGVYAHTGAHTYENRPYFEYIATSANATHGATYYQSCHCGAASTQTFTLPIEAQSAYAPTTPTVTLYDTEYLAYGITWNSTAEPITPAVELIDAYGETTTFYADTRRYSSYNAQDQSYNYYVSKVTVYLNPGAQYRYRIVDLCSGAATEYANLTAVNPAASKFTFASLSDSQDVSGGIYLEKVLSHMSDVDFYLHTGDICEDTKHEANWKAMLDTNRAFLMKTPMMITAGNHDTTYKSGDNELFKHFHNQIPRQSTTNDGYFYSFDYGNVRFIVLNTNLLSGNQLPQEQYSWLLSTLQNNPNRWTIVSMHCPMYSVGKWGSNPQNNATSLALRNQLQGIFAQYKVDLVIQGHDHTVSKTNPISATGTVQVAQTTVIGGISYSMDPQGPIYIMNGPAGTQTRTPVAQDASLYEYAMEGKSCSWAEYTIDGNTLTVTVKRYNGSHGRVETYATWGIQKS
jgi:3',5'-cyclic AMP phosphodiesterase CpdA